MGRNSHLSPTSQDMTTELESSTKPQTSNPNPQTLNYPPRVLYPSQAIMEPHRAPSFHDSCLDAVQDGLYFLLGESRLRAPRSKVSHSWVVLRDLK